VTTGGKIAGFLVVILLLLIGVPVALVFLYAGGLGEDEALDGTGATSSETSATQLVTAPRIGPDVAGDVTITVTSVFSQRGRAPLEGARVFIRETVRERERVVAEGTSASDGTVRLPGLESGRYEVWVEADGHRTRRVPLSNALVSVDVYKRARLQGLLRLKGGVPVVGAQVTIAVRDGGESEFTELGAPDPDFPAPIQLVSDADGRFGVDVAPGYPFELKILADGYPELVRDFGIVWPGKTRKAEITLRAGPAALIGTVPFAVEPDDDVQLILSPRRGREKAGRITQTSRFRFDEVAPGPVQVWVFRREARRLQMSSGTFQVEPGRLNDMGTLISPATRLTFQVSVRGPEIPDCELFLPFVRSRFAVSNGQTVVLEGAPRNLGLINASLHFKQADGRPGILSLEGKIAHTADDPAERTIVLEFIPAVTKGTLYVALPTPPVAEDEQSMRLVVEAWSESGPGEIVHLGLRTAPASDMRWAGKLVAGRYRVSGLTRAHATEPVFVDVRSGERAEVRLERWVASPPITGRILDADGRPFLRAHVQVVDEESADRARRWTFQFMNVGADGKFSIGWVPRRAGLKIIVTHAKLNVTLPVPADREKELEIELK